MKSLYSKTRQELINLERKAGNSIYEGLGDLLTTEVNSKNAKALGIAGLFLIGGCGGTLNTNYSKSKKFIVAQENNPEAEAINERDTPHRFAEFVNEKIGYRPVKSGKFEIEGKTYTDVPYIVKTVGSRNIINRHNPEDPILVEADKYFPLVPIKLKGNKKDYKYELAEQEDKTTERITKNKDKKMKIKVLEKFGFNHIKSTSADYDLPRIKIDNQEFYVFTKSKDVYSNNKKLETLPIAFIIDNKKSREIDHVGTGKIGVEGYMLRPVKGELIERGLTKEEIDNRNNDEVSEEPALNYVLGGEDQEIIAPDISPNVHKAITCSYSGMKPSSNKVEFGDKPFTAKTKEDSIGSVFNGLEGDKRGYLGNPKVFENDFQCVNWRKKFINSGKKWLIKDLKYNIPRISSK
tara:strand:- start:1254 stop:2474 length:1221 start_codon:yes stop_codon:yes gene_type:complete